MALGSASMELNSGVVERWEDCWGLQAGSPSCFPSRNVGSAGRRLEALFSRGLARS